MTTRNVLRIATVGAVALLLLLAGWIGHEIGRDAAVVVRVPEIRPTEPPGRDARRRVPRDRAAQGDAEDVPDDFVPPVVVPVPEPVVAPTDDAAEFPALEIQVFWSSGEPYSLATVYLLGEGAAGSDGATPPLAETDGDGRCMVHVPSPGRYDVGVTDGAFAHVVVPSVDVPGKAPLRVVLPPIADIRFEERPGDVADRVTVLTMTDPRRVEYPGRDQQRRALVRAWRDPQGVPMVSAPVGLELTGYVGNDSSLLLDPPRFSAPATVAIVRGHGVVAHLEFAPAARSWPVPSGIDVRFDWGAGSRTPTSSNEFRFELPAGIPLGEHPERYVTPTAVVPARRGTVRWSGPAIRAGQAAWDLDRGADVRVTIEVDDASEELTRRSFARVTDPEAIVRGAEDVEITLWTVVRDRDPRNAEQALHWTSNGVRLDEAVPLAPRAAWLLATAGGPMVAGPRTIDVLREETTLALRRGGWLVVVPERIADVGSGRVRRADGAPIPWIDTDGDAALETTAPLHTGQVLGPFEPGDLALVIDDAVGRREERRVTIRPGRCDVLRVATCPAPAR